MEYFNYTLSFSSLIANGFSVEFKKSARIRQSAYECARMRLWNKLAPNYWRNVCALHFRGSICFVFKWMNGKIHSTIYFMVSSLHFSVFTVHIRFVSTENGNFLLCNVLRISSIITMRYLVCVTGETTSYGWLKLPFGWQSGMAWILFDDSLRNSWIGFSFQISFTYHK